MPVFKFDKIPRELRRLAQWVLVRNGAPYNPRTQRYASVNDPPAWSTHEHVCQVFRRGRWDGIAFVFTKSDPYVGIDLDACRDRKTGRISDWALVILKRFLGCYTEISPSGTGLHLVVRGHLPPEIGRPVKKLKDQPSVGGKSPEIMMCQHGGAITLTGNCLKGRTTIKFTPRALKRFFRETFPDKPHGKNRVRSLGTADGVPAVLAADLARCRITDDRSGADFRLCVNAIRAGLSKERIWEFVRTESKFAERGGDYFELTWSKAFEAATAELFNALAVEKDKLSPLELGAIISRLREITGGWPRRVGSTLFVHDPEHGVNWLKNAPALFGWLKSQIGTVRWHNCSACITKEELFHELQRTAQSYLAVQDLPHEPLLRDYYYACDIKVPGDGSALQKLVDRFAPETDTDRRLIAAAFVTPMWGGPPGARPLLAITADGRGYGKTALAEFISQLYGGSLAFRKAEDIGVITQRLLSPEGMQKRLVILDNLKSRNFSWGDLESLITAPAISGKRMYVGEGTRPNDLTYITTVNAPSFATDVAQRSVFIRLNKPTHSGTWQSETQQFIETHRGALVADIIGLLRRKRFTLRKYSRWARWERDVLQRISAPNHTQAVILQRQNEANVEVELATTIEDEIRNQLQRRQHDASADCIRIPVAKLTEWYGKVTGNFDNVAVVSRMLKQMADEKHLKHLRKDKSRKHGRCFLWTGEKWDGRSIVMLKEPPKRSPTPPRDG